MAVVAKITAVAKANDPSVTFSGSMTPLQMRGRKSLRDRPKRGSERYGAFMEVCWRHCEKSTDGPGELATRFTLMGRSKKEFDHTLILIKIPHSVGLVSVEIARPFLPLKFLE
jgi:hypothetical protein